MSRAARGAAVTTALCALALTVIQYRMTVSYGFYYDDYHFVRPYRAAEVIAAFHGPWDASGIETAYYRPLTICLYAARFALFGVNAEAYHLLSLAMFAVAAATFAIFTMRIAGSSAAGVLAAIALTLHPGMPYSAVAWITNQMHLTELLVVIAGLGWWFAVRRRSAIWWLPLILFQAAALLIKEDGVMLLPAVIVLHTARKWLVEPDLDHVPPGFVAAAAVAIGGLLWIRQEALHGAAHIRLPSFDQARANIWRGLTGAFGLVPARRPYQTAASWFVTIVPLLALVLWRRISPPLRFAMVSGLAVGVLFDLPFAFIIKAEQLHVVSLGASLFLAASAAALLHACGGKRVAVAALGVCLVSGFAALAAVTRHITRDFEPFAPGVRTTDRYVGEWAAVPLEWRDYLAHKGSSPAPGFDANPARALQIVGFGLHGVEIAPNGTPVRWMSGATADFFVRRDVRLVKIPLHHEIGAFREPARVRAVADGRIAAETVLTDGAWQPLTIALSPRATPRLGGTHHIELRIDHAWVPARVIPGSGDTRTLGLQVGPIVLR